MQFFTRLRDTLHSLQRGPACRVVFYYPGEEPTYLEDAYVTVFRNGMVEIIHRSEHVTTHVQNVEIVWKTKSASGSTGRMLSLIKTDAKV